MKFDMLQALALRILQVKILPQKLKNVTPKATNPTPNQHQLCTMPSLRIGMSVQTDVLLKYFNLACQVSYIESI